jgi:hypothetical protein
LGAHGVTFAVGAWMRRRREHKLESGEIAELAALADGWLAPARRLALEERVAASSELADRLLEQRQAVALTRAAAEEVTAPADLRMRVETQPGWRRAGTRRRAVLVGAVASAVLAAAVGLALLQSRASGESFHAALAATKLAPGAGGSATLTKTSSGWRIELDARGLPRLAGARYYEAWLRSSGGVLVPVGTFNEARGVTLWAGVSPMEFRALTVTREQADGDQTSSGEKVLVGTGDTGG